MQKGLKKIGLALLAVGLSITLLLAGAMPVCEAGPDGKKVRPIKIGLHGGFSGLWATVALDTCQGVIDYTKYASDQGLIDGIPVEITWEDSGSSVSKSITAHRRFIEEGVVLEMNWNSTPVDVMAPRYKRDEMPMLYYGCLTEMMITEPIRWVFSIFPGWQVVGASFAKWTAEHLPEERPVRLAMIGYDNASARAGVKGLETAAQKGISCDFLGVEWVPIATIDTSTELLRLAAKKPDWIFLAISGATTTVVCKDFARLGLRERGINAMTALGSTTGEVTLKAVGKDFIGIYSQFGWPVASEADWDLPGEKLIREIANRYRGWGPEKVWGGYISGCMHAMVGIEGIRLAVEKVGYDNLTPQAVRDGLANIKDFDSGLIPLVTMSDKQPWYQNYFRVYICREVGKYELVSDWEKVPYFLDYFERLRN